jgi:hypothetical protein
MGIKAAKPGKCESGGAHCGAFQKRPPGTRTFSNSDQVRGSELLSAASGGKQMSFATTTAPVHSDSKRTDGILN